MGFSKCAQFVLFASSMLALAACDNSGEAKIATTKFLKAVAEKREADACALVWYGESNPARCTATTDTVRALKLENAEIESVGMQVHDIGAYVVLRSSSGKRVQAELFCSTDKREHRPGADCGWYIANLTELPAP
jgi:hypothetical protein